MKLARSENARPIRTSQALREILTKNPRVKRFTVRRIIDSMGSNRVGASLMLFAVPGMLRLPETHDLLGAPTCLIGGQMLAGRTKISLPRGVLERSVPRRSLAVLIHSIVPVLERVERVLKPRWGWVYQPASRCVVGLMIFLLGLALACPFLSFGAAQAVSLSAISLGLAEQDGLVISIGVLAGFAALAVAIGTAISGEGLWVRVRRCVKDAAKRLGFDRVVAQLQKFGLKWKCLLDFNWEMLLLLRDPEASSPRGIGAGSIKNHATSEPMGHRFRGRTKHARIFPLRG